MAGSQIWRLFETGASASAAQIVNHFVLYFGWARCQRRVMEADPFWDEPLPNSIDDSAVGFVGRPPPGARKCAPNVETMKISSRDTLFWDEHLPNAVGDSAAGFVGRPPPGARKCAPNFEILPTMSAEHAMPDEQDPVLGDSPICLFGDW